MLLALVVGTAGLAASAAGVSARLLPRRFTAQQQQQIVAWEMARRWRTMPAGKIFPSPTSCPRALSAPARRCRCGPTG